MFKIIPFPLLLFCFISCSSNLKLVKQSSIFVDENLLGMSKENLIGKFGKPFSRDVKTVDGVFTETLYYAESIKRIVLITKFVFVGNNLVEQSYHSTDFESQKIKELETEIRRNRLRNRR